MEQVMQHCCLQNLAYHNVPCQTQNLEWYKYCKKIACYAFLLKERPAKGTITAHTLLHCPELARTIQLY